MVGKRGAAASGGGQAEGVPTAEAPALLQLDQEVLAAALDNVGALVVAFDAGGKLVFFNPICERLSGFAAAEVLGRPVVSLIPAEEEALAKAIEGALEKGEVPQSFRSHWVTRSGERRLIAWTSAAVRGPGGGLRYVVASGSDLTEFERTEEALRASQRELELLNDIARVFLTVGGDEMYAQVLERVLAATGSRHGIFGYLNRVGDLVCPSLTRDIWDQCQMEKKTILFPRSSWKGIWGRAMLERRTIVDNRSFAVPEGHIPVNRALAVPIVHGGETVGYFLVGNRDRDYGPADVELLERVAASTAPVLRARLDREWRELERKVTEEALLASERRYRTLFDAASDAIFIHDTEGYFVEANRAASERLGYSHDELLGLGPKDVDSPAFAAKVPERMEELLRQGRAYFETEHRTKDGRLIPSELSAQVIDYGGRQMILAIARDISERKRAERALEEARAGLEQRVQERTTELSRANEALRKEIGEKARLQCELERSAAEWRGTFDAVPSPVLVLDATARVVRMNRAAAELSGSGEPGRKVGTLGPGEPWQEAGHAAERVLAGEKAVVVQVRDLGSGKTWDVVASPFAEPGSAEPRAVVVAQDVTETARLQESLRRSQTAAAMGQLVAGVAHEVRNPLFGITATLDAAEARLGERPEFTQYTNVLRREVERLNKLMQDLLTYGRPQALERTEMTAAAALAEGLRACAPLAQLRGARLTTRVEEGLPTVRADLRRIAQVVQNLVDNALRHTASGGEVLARAGSVEEDGRRWLELAVEDSGPGFKQDELGRVFEPFYSRRRDGTGLGLSIVQKIVEEHGGRVSAANRPEGGAVVRARLPLG